MRAKDLKVDGTTYYYTTNDTWLRWAHHPERVRVLDATPGRWSYDRRTEEWTRRPGGQDVLVEVLAKGGNAARRVAVRTQTIRGEWDVCAEQVAEAGRQRQADERERTAAMAAIEGPCADAVAALRELGITAVDMDSDRRHLYARVSIGFRSAPALLAAARHLLATGWKPPTI